MNFSDKFKKIYWILLLIILTALCIWRLCVGMLITFDIYLFVLWFIIVLFPIISEISIFGVNVKKDIESAKNELKAQLFEIKNSINNNQNQTVNIHTAPASQREIEQKQKEDLTDENSNHSKRSKYIPKDVSITHVESQDKKVGTSEKAIERAAKISKVESLVNSYLSLKYGDNYKPQMKIEDVESGKKMVTDGIILKGEKISEIIEIKYAGSGKFESLFFIASRFIKKLKDLGVRYSVRFIIVSDLMDKEHAFSFNQELNKIGFAKSLGANSPRAKGSYFKLSEDKIEEVTLE